MDNWSSSDSETGRDDDDSNTEWGESGGPDGEWAEDEPAQPREAFVGRRPIATVQWAARFLRESPIILLLAVAASSLELFAPQSDLQLFTIAGGLLRGGVSVLGLAIVVAVTAVVTEDSLADRKRSLLEQGLAVVRSLPALLVTLVGFFLVFYFGVYLPSIVIPILGLVFGLSVGVYFASLFLVVVSAVVLDQSVGQGRGAFAGARLLVAGIFVVLVVGHAPLVVGSPTLAEPVLAIGLVAWAGLLTAVSAVASTRVYIANCPAKSSHTGAGMAQSRGQPVGRTGMWKMTMTDSENRRIGILTPNNRTDSERNDFRAGRRSFSR